jgi:SSS family solute:Na+ symporter
LAGRFATLGLMILACGLALLMQDALSNFELMLQIGAGTGLLLILRWFWWRINAAAEITAMVVSFGVAALFFLLNRGGATIPFWVQLVGGVSLTTVAWLIVALMTPPTDMKTLQRFHEIIQPGGPGWRPVESAIGTPGKGPGSGGDLTSALACAVASTIAIWSLVFATGYFIYGRTGLGAVFSAVVAVGVVIVLRNWRGLKFR